MIFLKILFFMFFLNINESFVFINNINFGQQNKELFEQICRE